ncbi:MAG: L,D-transpeptidase family protein [Nitratireductor sp.]|nr:L,D-transpeptidase family protein [Nitratireductor sp.]
MTHSAMSRHPASRCAAAKSIHEKLASSLFGLALSAFAVAALPAGGACAETGLTEVTLHQDQAEVDGVPLITVSIAEQRLRYYSGTHLVTDSNISSGKAGHSTPKGIYSILEKKRMHRSNLYDDAPMPFMQRLTWSGIALHESRHVPAYPASHGCVRMPGDFAKELFSMTERGVHVVISEEVSEPRPISHAALFQPGSEPKVVAALRDTMGGIPGVGPGVGTDAMPEVAAELPDPDRPLRIYITRTTKRDEVRHLQEMLIHAGFDTGGADGLYGRKTVSAVIDFQKDTGLQPTGTMTDELLASLQQATAAGPLPAARLYVRRGHEPVFEAAVQVRDAAEPLGTQLFIAANDPKDAERLSWTATAIASRIPAAIIRDHQLAVDDPAELVHTQPSLTLDRLTIDKETRQRIEAILVAGSSLIVSDNGWGFETGKGTDFIVPLR